MDWEPLYRAFPVNKELIWLNNCGTTPSNAISAGLMSEYLEGYSSRGVLQEKFPFPVVRSEIVNILAELLGCASQDLCLIHNTAEGMHFLSHDLSLDKGDTVVVLENEYPSNYYPWEQLASKGVAVRGVSPKDLSNEDFSLTDLFGPSVKVVSLSACHWCTGERIPLERVGRWCRENGVFFIVDGAQGVGMLPIDISKANIAAMAFPAWKWLLGPLGLGVLYISQNCLNSLNFSFKGTSSVSGSGYLPYKKELHAGAKRYEYSTVNFIDWIYFLGSLRMLKDVGFETVMKRITQLADIIDEILTSQGWEVFPPKDRAGIITFSKPGVEAHKVLAHLTAHGIVAAERMGRVRLAPHIYISELQLNRVGEALSSL